MFIWGKVAKLTRSIYCTSYHLVLEVSETLITLKITLKWYDSLINLMTFMFKNTEIKKVSNQTHRDLFVTSNSYVIKYI